MAEDLSKEQSAAGNQWVCTGCHCFLKMVHRFFLESAEQRHWTGKKIVHYFGTVAGLLVPLGFMLVPLPPDPSNFVFEFIQP